MSRHALGYGLALGCAVLLALSAEPLSAGREVPDFTGSWQLDEARSENLREKVREQMRQHPDGGPSPRGGFGRGPGGRGGGLGRPGGGAGGAGRDRSAMPVPRDELAAGIERLEVEHAEPSLVIVYADGRRLELDTDEPTEIETAAGTRKTSCRWTRQGWLSITTRDERRKVTETWRLDELGGELWVTLELAARGPMPAIRVARTYVRVRDDGGDAGFGGAR